MMTSQWSVGGGHYLCITLSVSFALSPVGEVCNNILIISRGTQFRQERTVGLIITGFRGNKAISMMGGKSPPLELILEIVESNNSLIF